MAVEIGTAAGHIDLMNKLMTFLSTNSDLVAAGQQWEVLRNSNLPMPLTWPGRIAFYNNGSGSNSFPTTMPDAVPAGLNSSVSIKIRFAGKISLPSDGSYAFALLAKDQMELRIDGVLIAGVYASNAANSFTQTGSAVTLSAGLHDIEVTFITGSTAGIGMSLGWKKPGDASFSIIPAGNYSDMTGAYGYADYANPTAADMQAVIADKEYVVKGPGLSGSDAIYMAMRTVSSVQNDLYNVLSRYTTGYNENASQGQQPGVGSAAYSLMWNQDIKYWFIANGRRFIVIAKISTTYASLYGGFILPYGLPSEIPYPIAAGASCAINARWSIQTENHSSFWNPGGYSSDSVGSLYLRRTDGAGDVFKNIYYQAEAPGKTYPYSSLLGFRTSPSNDYALQPVVLYSTAGGGNVWGEFDGVFHIPGYNNASENTLVIGGKTYLIVQSGYRTTASDYAAILLE
ncbi:PA14 domain-containing protein [Pseudomonas citronellolis]|uniref:PA14 domain-containing protein n=1 Tax=Pseudomonas citronellolis TaxID=53408 RepID=UPI00248DA02F|nr:PA14 domain-containing protein [Pseudomonas citronellolis]